MSAATLERPVVTTPGIYQLTNAQYHADPVPDGSLSVSGAKRILEAPAKYQWERTHPVFKDTFDYGTAAHSIVLEGDETNLVVVDADSWRTKLAQEQRDSARADGKTPLLVADYHQVRAMADAIRQHPIASALLDPTRGKAEQSGFWQDERTGIWRRLRTDWLPDHTGSGRLLVPDYKTAASAEKREFGAAAMRLGYHQQDAWYTEGLRALGVADDIAFLFIVQEKTAPYIVNVIELPQHAKHMGAERNNRAIDTYIECTTTGRWPGYSDDVELAYIPRWAEIQHEEEYS